MSREFYEKIANLPPKRLALLALELNTENEALKRTRSEPIAIVGTSCRLPGGVETPEDFWRLLSNGVDAIREVPRDRWDAEALFDPEPGRPGKTYARWGGFIDGIEHFDAGFFGISPREASRMDPQHRMLLELAWEALERSGQPADQLAGSRTGVFLGVIGSDYARLQAERLGGSLDIYHLTGTCLNAAAGRLSYALGLQGPSMAIDTACSSSLVALHTACQSLRNRDCDLALAAGVNLVLSPEGAIALASSRGLAPDGRCKTFDEAADGFVRAEGVAVVVLKRLSQAQADGDDILALIAGSSVNQDGASSGLMVPNGPAQERVIRQALANAGLSPSEISFIEAHGTGTSLGDPIELQALAQVFGEGRTTESPLVVGAVKSNIGHLEATAGLAGILKVVLALRHEAIPRNLHFKRLNPNIAIGDAPVVIPTEQRPWPRGERPRFAGVSAFGLSGTNAHIILGEAPKQEETPTTARGAELMVLSARSPEALVAVARRHAAWLTEHPEVSLRDACATAALRRAHHEHRLAIAGRTHAEVAEKLQALANGEAVAGGVVGRKAGGARRRVVFVFPGQGSQWLGMGRRLLEEEPAFRTALRRCAEAIRAEAGFDVLEVLAADAEHSRLGEIDVIQPVLFAMEVALAELWRAWGIEPDAVVGHSMGEVAAAHVAGALSLEDAAAIICRRSKLLRTVSGRGAMFMVDLTLEEAKEALRGFEDRVSVAVSNGVRSTVLSGDPVALEAVTARLAAREVFFRPVKVDVASHSPQMDPLRPDLLAALQGVQPRAANIPMCSTVTGGMVDGTSLQARYWADNLREPVLFSTAIERLATEGHDLFIELSPHPILLPAVEQHLRHLGRGGIVVPSLRRDEDERSSMLAALGAIHVSGHAVDLRRQHPVRGRPVALPTYAWQRESFWVEAPAHSRRARTAGRHPLLGEHVALAAQPGTHLWQTELAADSPAYLSDHLVHGEVVLPGAAYLEMAVAGAVEALGAKRWMLEDVSFQALMTVPREEGLPVQLGITPEAEGTSRFQIFSRPSAEASWTLHAEGRLRAEAGEPVAFSLEETRTRCTERVDGEAHYQVMQERGVDFGPSFRVLKELWRTKGEALARFELPPSVASELSTHQIHPVLLDACFQVINGAALGEARGETFVPVGLDSLRVHGRPGRALWGHGVVRRDASGAEGTLEGEVTLIDAEGRVLVEARGLVCRRLKATRRRSVDEIDSWMYAVDWQESPRTAPATPATGREPGVWLLFGDRQGFGRKVQALLEARGESCVLVAHGESYRRVEAGRYEVDPSRPEGFTQLLKSEFGAGKPACRGIVHLFSLDAPGPGERPEALAEAQRLGVKSALHLAQALVEASFRDVPRLWLVSGGIHAVNAGDAVSHVEHAPLWGLGRVLSVEHSELACTNVDLQSLDEAEAASFVEELLTPSPEDQLALRGGARFVARLERMEREATPATELRPDGTYLITGGLGGLGLKLAEWLVSRGARSLALVGRREASEEARRVIEKLEATGVQVQVCKADVAVREDVARVIAELQGGAPLRGLIHAAAVLDDAFLVNLTAERFDKVMAPKVQGAWNLHAATAGLPLDFFVLFSAAGALLGSPGQGNYVASNTFLDSLAAWRRGQGLPALSINWGAWGEVGLAAASTNRGDRMALRGIASMSPDQALEALGRLLGSTRARVAVMRFDLRQWREFYLTASQSPFVSRLPIEQSATTPSRATTGAFVEKLKAAAQGEQPRLLEAHLREQIGQVLRLSPAKIDPQVSLGSLGLDSLMGLEIRNRLEASLGLRLQATLLWRHPTVEGLVGFLVERLQLAPAPKVEQPRNEEAALEAAIVNNVKQLSDAEAEALLAEKLAAFGEEN
ncbi:type I polyketide synthase [Myxococcus landrumensis]|uniref:Type I polyketide synthase n=1 Tax=Myxococcus landrumensis TaxID=2813577 RepID=A0ABX7ND67_9BACT|nr:type I polyketide synthase [Myxococcus landrumus]QSQ15454.1 type I polyketide synthase [Myxococcus landrumus]